MTQIGCDSFHIYGSHSNQTEAITFNNLDCNYNCDCSTTQYDPICSADGITVFFSPCQAGCRGVEELIVDHKPVFGFPGGYKEVRNQNEIQRL